MSEHGVGNVAAGALTLTAGAAEISTLARRTLLGNLGRIGFLGKVPIAAPLAGLANIVNAVMKYSDGARHGDHKQMAIGSIKAMGGGLMVASVFIGGPILVGIGGLLDLGAFAWENLSGRKKGSSTVKSSSPSVHRVGKDVPNNFRSIRLSQTS